MTHWDPGGKACDSRAADLGSNPALSVGLFPGRVIPGTDLFPAEGNVSEVPSGYLRYLPCVRGTFHVSEVPSMYLRYLPCSNKSGLSPSASCLINQNVNDEKCLPLV